MCTGDRNLVWRYSGTGLFVVGIFLLLALTTQVPCAAGPGQAAVRADCPGDLDGDLDVDLEDLAGLLSHYGMLEGATYGDGDLDGDGDVDLADLAALLAVYGATCEDPNECVVECPPGAELEGEPCGDDANGGCGADPPVFRSVECGVTICGTAWAEDWQRDTDWFEVVLEAEALLTFSVEAEFDVMFGLVQTDPPGAGDCSCMTGYVDPWTTAGPCEPAVIHTCVLPAGTYWLWLAPVEFEGVSCGEDSDYVAVIECEAP